MFLRIFLLSIWRVTRQRRLGLDEVEVGSWAAGNEPDEWSEDVRALDVSGGEWPVARASLRVVGWP